MNITFDKTQPNVLLGLGVSEVRFNKIKSELGLEGLELNEAVDRAINSEYSDNEKLGLIFEFGANFGFQIERQKFMAAIQQQETEALKQLSEVSKSDEVTKH